MPIRLRCDCGQEIDAPDELAGGQGRCPGCDAVLAIPAPREEAPVRRCPFCGEQIQPTARRCRFCGSDQQAPAPEQPTIQLGPRNLEAQPEAEQQARTGLLLALAGFVVPCVAIATTPLAISAGGRARELARRGNFPVPQSATAAIVLGWLALGWLMLLLAAGLLLVGLARRFP